MTFTATVPEDEATGRVADIYDRLRQSLGFVPNYGKAFSLRPELFETWTTLNSTIKGVMDPRHYELATVAAAIERRSSYCTLAHGEKLLDLGSSPEELRGLVGGNAELDSVDQAIVDFATKVAQAPGSIERQDIDHLRSLELTDETIFDLAAAAAARLFFTALCDALGTRPDSAYHKTLPDLVETLSVGRSPDDPPSEQSNAKDR